METVNQELQKYMDNVRKRIDEGRISREITYEELIEGTPSRERMLGRLEAYLQTGVVIDPNNIMKIIEEYSFSPEEYKPLIMIAHRGLIEGLVQEPNNMRDYNYRMVCFTKLSSKYFE